VNTSVAVRRGRALPLRPRALAAIVGVTLVGIGAFTWPLLIGFDGSDSGHSHDAPWIFLLILPLLLLVVAAEIADGGMDAKAVALLGVLGGICAVLRPVTGGVTGVQLMFFLLVPAGRVMGPGFGFVLGNAAMFASAALTGGGGPWLPFQMLAAGWIGMFAGLLPRARGRAEIVLLAAYGFVAGVAYGFILNLWFWPFGTSNIGTSAAVAFAPNASLAENLRRWLAFSTTSSLGFDIPRGLITALAVLLVGRPVLLALRRAARRAAFDAPVQFEPAAGPHT
jgi:energy-coupling factor transport system substrate-specific component